MAVPKGCSKERGTVVLMFATPLVQNLLQYTFLGFGRVLLLGFQCTEFNCLSIVGFPHRIYNLQTYLSGPSPQTKLQDPIKFNPLLDYIKWKKLHRLKL